MLLFTLLTLWLMRSDEILGYCSKLTHCTSSPFLRSLSEPSSALFDNIKATSTKLKLLPDLLFQRCPEKHIVVVNVLGPHFFYFIIYNRLFNHWSWHTFKAVSFVFCCIIIWVWRPGITLTTHQTIPAYSVKRWIWRSTITNSAH